MMSLWDALRMNMMISYQELVRTFLCSTISDFHSSSGSFFSSDSAIILDSVINKLLPIRSPKYSFIFINSSHDSLYPGASAALSTPYSASGFLSAKWNSRPLLLLFFEQSIFHKRSKYPANAALISTRNLLFSIA